MGKGAPFRDQKDKGDCSGGVDDGKIPSQGGSSLHLRQVVLEWVSRSLGLVPAWFSMGSFPKLLRSGVNFNRAPRCLLLQ
ncbi:hypothetical protein EDM55_19275 [Brevibacillus centrosporus]|nr:hypothetical protein EDM55_19275 [Brevibacillus centrosporus]